MDPKQRAGEAVIEFIQSNMVVGLGTGSTADCFHVALARAIKSGKLVGIRGVPTSRRAEVHANELGIPLATLAQCPHPDVTVDGADEVAPNLDLIKGLGGALLREKIVAQNSKKLIIIADSSKTVDVLGTRSPVPVEVATFGHETQPAFLRSLGCEPVLRLRSDGSPFVTDNSNYIYDCKFPRIDDPRALERSLKSRAGIVDSGLFLGIASLAIIATDNDVRQLKR
jgi:ribose 5-phosphate isomerase A